MVMLAVPTPIGEVAGLAERVVVDGELDRTAAELATRLSNGPPAPTRPRNPFSGLTNPVVSAPPTGCWPT